MRIATLALLFALPLSAMPVIAQTVEEQTAGQMTGEMNTDGISAVCQLTILCPDTGACRDWDQQITISSGEDTWEVIWSDDLRSDYDLIADYMSPADAVAQTRVRSLLFRNTATQTSQLITFDGDGNVVVTSHQPQAGTQVVTGIGTCTVPE